MNTQYHNMTVAQLRKIATKYNIDRFLRKEELIEAIIENDNIKAHQSEFVSIKFAFRTECENDVYDICHKCTENNLDVTKFSLTYDSASPDCTVDGFTLCVAFDKEDVLPTPGTSSINRWPPASRQATQSCTWLGLPTSTVLS